MNIVVDPYDPEDAGHRQQLAFDLTDTIVAEGFVQEKVPRGYEMLFSRATGDPNLRLLIYTSIVKGQVRRAAKDAIRVAAVYTAQKDGQERGVIKATRIHRTGTIGAIINRLLSRIREIESKCHTVQRCDRCGAPLFTSKKGNLVCAELCWKGRF